MAIINPLSTKNAQIDIKSGTGGINLGTDAAAKDITIGSSTGASSLTLNTGSGGLKIPSFTTTGALVSNASGTITDANASTAGYVLTSNGSGTAPSFQAVVSPNNWSVVTSNTSMSSNAGYIANSASRLVLTLPTTAAVGEFIDVCGISTGGWQISQNSGQYIYIGSSVTTTGTSGNLQSNAGRDSMRLLCVVANTAWTCFGGPLSAGITVT